MDSISGARVPEMFSAGDVGRGGERDIVPPLEDKTVLSGKHEPLNLIDPKMASTLGSSASVSGKSDSPADHVIELTNATFGDFIQNATLPVVVDFHNPT
jgi:hypothetical protein